MSDTESERLGLLLAGGRLDEIAVECGEPEDWTATAISYLKAALNGTCGGTLGGTVRVSAAAVGLLLTHAERLEMRLGDIPAPGGEVSHG